MPQQALNLQYKLKLIDDFWSPRVIAEMNDYQFKPVKVKGEFVWHEHAHIDETFIVLEGSLHIEFREGHVVINAAELYVVAAGVEHRPVAENEVSMLLIEPRGLVNTDASGGELTARGDRWI